jgi:putative MATE family efflux protein
MSARTITPAPLSAPTNTPKPAAAARTKLLLEGPILPTLLRLAAPNVLNLLAFVGVIVFDGFFLGRIGTNALAGASLAFPFVMLVLQTTNSGMGAGVTSAIARALGAGKRDRADELVFHALLLALVLGVLFSTLMLLTAPIIFGWMGGRGEMLSDALAYANVALGGAVCITVLNLLGNAVRGTGNMSLHAGVLVGCVVAHIVLSPLLIFGWGPIPALGPAGAGWGLVIPFAVGSLIIIRYLRSSDSIVRLNFRGMVPRWELFADILKVGVPGLVNTAITNLSIVILTGIAGQFGAEAAIGYAMGARLEYIMQPIAFGFGTAIVAMVGTNWGDGGHELGCRTVPPRASDRLDGCYHDRSRVRHDWTDRRRTAEPLVGPIQQRPRSRAHWRAVSSDCRTGVSVLRAGPRLVFREPRFRPRHRGYDRQCPAPDCERRCRARSRVSAWSRRFGLLRSRSRWFCPLRCAARVHGPSGQGPGGFDVTTEEKAPKH